MNTRTRTLIYGLLISCILLAGAVVVQRHSALQSRRSEREAIKLYGEKNDELFLELISKFESLQPLSDTLSSISSITDMKDRVHNQMLLDLGKKQADTATDDIIQLIQAADVTEEDEKLRYRVNMLIMTSKKQEDVALLAFSGNLWRAVYNTSSRYWHSEPKVIDRHSLYAMSEAAIEVNALNQTMLTMRARAQSLREQSDAEDTKVRIPLLKQELLDSLAPHLQKLAQINDSYNTEAAK
ncbi:hypothetical protein [Paenibacillus silvisoli]|uniref:hypothetical protein n=1 Tax=Paenibacillus silvisoli TaxID=3110539 RepID=UPI002805AD7C|nr:hypothetical protein [Paenibacillus silvisoli]